MRRCSGSILVTSLWVLMLLTVFSLSLSFGVRQKASLLSRLGTLNEMYSMANSVSELAKSIVKQDVDETVDSIKDDWAAPGGVTEVLNKKLVNGSIALGDNTSGPIVDEERKINVNKTSGPILGKLIEKVTKLSPGDAESLAYNIIDWSDTDSLYGHAQYGAERKDYDSSQNPYGPKDSPMENIDELLLVKGMNREIFDKIVPYVTVYGEGRVNINTASKEVLEALGFSDKGLELILKTRDGVDGILGSADDNYFSDITSMVTRIETITGERVDDSQRGLISQLDSQSRLGVNSRYFSTRAVVEHSRTGAIMTVDVAFYRKGQLVYQRFSDVRYPIKEPLAKN